MEELISQRVHRYYWEEDVNCATTMLKTLAEIFTVSLSQQIIDSAIAMHGAGKFGAQCGLVEGSLMFMGLWGREQGYSDQQIVDKCCIFAQSFQDKFGSLLCRELRIEGFKPDNPPHLCEEITKKAVAFTAEYINKNFKEGKE